MYLLFQGLMFGLWFGAVIAFFTQRWEAMIGIALFGLFTKEILDIIYPKSLVVHFPKEKI